MTASWTRCVGSALRVGQMGRGLQVVEASPGRRIPGLVEAWLKTRRRAVLEKRTEGSPRVVPETRSHQEHRWKREVLESWTCRRRARRLARSPPPSLTPHWPGHLHPSLKTWKHFQGPEVRRFQKTREEELVVGLSPAGTAGPLRSCL